MYEGDLMKLNNLQVKEMLIEISKMFEERKEELSKYDSIIGDGDHGISMARGTKLGKEKITPLENEKINEYFKIYGRALIADIGGAIGPLFGSIFTEFGKATKGKDELGVSEFVSAIEGAKNKIMDFGGAKVGDKTMIDAIVPTVEAAKEAENAGMDLYSVLEKSEEAAEQGVKDTIPLVAKKGRSKYLREKSVGHQDAGATSFYYLIKTIKDYINNTDVNSSKIGG